MNRTKCPACGMVNFAEQEMCRRCGTSLLGGGPSSAGPVHAREPQSRGFWGYVRWATGVALACLAASYGSLVVTSEPLTGEEQQMVMAAIAELEQAGFARPAFALRRLANFRRTDNWWNAYVGHQTAYAATNFPFGVITVYPPFFMVPVDDRERATILLHESYHLLGDDEKETLERVWLEKRQLGWTEDAYGGTRVWRNTREWTLGRLPYLFECGSDGESDCRP